MGKIIEPKTSLEVIEKMVKDHLNRGIERRNHPFKNFVLSTTDGRIVDSRMVVLRNKVNAPFTLSAFTDIRSGKIDHIKKVPEVSGLFWHPSAKFQVRVKAHSRILHNDSRTESAYADTTPLGKTAYNTESAPGSVLDATEWEPANVREPLNDDYFAILDFIVFEMDVLQLSRDGHIRAHFKYDENGSCADSAFVTP